MNPEREAGGPLARMSARRERLSFGGLASLALHGFAVGGWLILMARHPPSAPPERTSIEMVFQPADEADPSREPEIETQARLEPPPPETAAELPALASPPEQVRGPSALAPQESPSSPPAPTLPLSRPLPPASRPSPLLAPRPSIARVSRSAPRLQLPPDHHGSIGSGVTAPTARPATPAMVQPVQPIASAEPAPRPAVAAIDPSWQAALLGWLASRKTYPEEALRRGDQGLVSIRFTVDRFGHVLEKAVVGGSGFPRLDEAALAMLRQGALPAFPAAMIQPRVTITTTIRYLLRQGGSRPG